MSRPAGVWPATNELVAVAWLSTRVAGIDAAQVATTLPKDVTKWADAGFVQVQALPGGAPDIDGLGRHPVLQLDFWAASVDAAGNIGAKPPWNLANRLAELVRIATEDAQTGHYGMPLDLGADFAPVRVQAAYLISEPTRVTGDPSGYARYTSDLKLDWVRQ